MQTTHGRPRVPNAPETIQRGRVVGFRQAARLRVTGVAPRYPLRPRVVAHATRPAAAC
jgi:hypothetical protein